MREYLHAITDAITGDVTTVPYTTEEIAEHNAPMPVPQEVDAWQAKTALEQAGLLLDVESAIMSMTGPSGASARKDWYSAPKWKRNWPLVIAMQQLKGWSDEFVDQLFISASKV